jgi:alpha-beta hydrolase superfamily lysophospholipase
MTALDARSGAPLDLTSWDTFLRSLSVRSDQVAVVGGQLIPGPPKALADVILRLGFGGLFLDSPRTREILSTMGLDPRLAAVAGQRLRGLADWRGFWEDMASPHLRRVEVALRVGALGTAADEIVTALTMLDLAYSGDGFYVHTPATQRRRLLATRRRLYAQLRAVLDERIDVLAFDTERGPMTGVFHAPKHGSGPWPTLLGLHPLNSDKDSYDVTLGVFRQTGFATFTIDFPAHGEHFDGARLEPTDERVALGALEALAAYRAVDIDRMYVIGGSLGGFFALRTAGADGRAAPRLAGCVAYAAPFDIGGGIDLTVMGVRRNFAHMIGEDDLRRLPHSAEAFHLYTVLGDIQCPVLLVHGTQDHVSDFSSVYQIARRIAHAPVYVHPLRGIDHEAASPSTLALAQPAIDWLTARRA